VSNQPLRWLAKGRDPSATIDSSFSFSKNEGDNEITGTTVSDGDPSPNGLLGARIPSLFDDGWRWFYTQQHGDNTTWEVVPSHRISASRTTNPRSCSSEAKAPVLAAGPSRLCRSFDTRLVMRSGPPPGAGYDRYAGAR
jgi:hypothetical protein